MAGENKEGGILALTPIALTILRQVMAFITAERARTGLTYEEIFAQAASHLDENEAALKADIEG